MTGFRFGIRNVLFGLLVAATCIAGFAIYNRFFDGSGGTFCEVRDTEITLSKKQICLASGIDLDVSDPRRIGNRGMVLLKYRDGIAFDCFWFDRRAFSYSTGGFEPTMTEHCSNDLRDFQMRRKAPR